MDQNNKRHRSITGFVLVILLFSIFFLNIIEMLQKYLMAVIKGLRFLIDCGTMYKNLKILRNYYKNRKRNVTNNER